MTLLPTHTRGTWFVWKKCKNVLFILRFALCSAKPRCVCAIGLVAVFHTQMSGTGSGVESVQLVDALLRARATPDDTDTDAGMSPLRVLALGVTQRLRQQLPLEEQREKQLLQPPPLPSPPPPAAAGGAAAALQPPSPSPSLSSLQSLPSMLPPAECAAVRRKLALLTAAVADCDGGGGGGFATKETEAAQCREALRVLAAGLAGASSAVVVVVSSETAQNRDGPATGDDDEVRGAQAHLYDAILALLG